MNQTARSLIGTADFIRQAIKEERGFRVPMFANGRPNIELLKAQGMAGEQRLRSLKADIADYQQVVDWLQLNRWEVRPDVHSRFHDFIEAVAHDKIRDLAKSGTVTGPESAAAFERRYAGSQVIIIQDRLADLFDGETLKTADFRLPFPNMLHEMHVGGSHVLAMLYEDDLGEKGSGIFVQTSGSWMFLGKEDQENSAIVGYCWDQISAAYVLMDAELATTECTRIPEKVNRKRERRGKPLIRDFHTVRLLNRHRYAVATMHGSHASPRLHFRRGHWRHLGEHKTWVRWCLVGDPTLGFVDKQYKI